MPQAITRAEMLQGIQASNRIQSATWHRRVNKIVKRCTACDTETASHGGERFCNTCTEFVATYDSHEADEGDLITMNFIPRIPERTKNFTPAGGFLFNAPDRETAEQMKREHGLIQALKMDESIPLTTETGEIIRRIATGDLKAVPRLIPIPDVVSWKANGVEYVPVD